MKQFGISGECLDRRLEIEDEERGAYLTAYPTRWRRFLHWLGIAINIHKHGDRDG